MSCPGAIFGYTDCVYANPSGCYSQGQCTRYAYSRRPDLGCGLGDAYTWASRAAALGFPVSHVPSAGDIAQYPGGYCGSDSVGHVAYVEAVNADGSILLSEMNWCASYHIDHRMVPASAVPGIFYIGRKGGTPAPAPTPPPPPPTSPPPAPAPPASGGMDFFTLLLLAGGGGVAWWLARQERITVHVERKAGTGGEFGASTLRVHHAGAPPRPHSTTPSDQFGASTLREQRASAPPRPSPAVSPSQAFTP